MRRRATRRRSSGGRGLRLEDLPAAVRARIVGLEHAPKAAPKPEERSKLELTLLSQIRMARLPEPEPEFHFARPQRQWRFDFAWPPYWLAVEVQGGVFNGGKHGRGSGLMKDAEKLSHAAILGWRVLLATSPQIRSGEAVEWIRKALERGVAA